MTASLLSLHLPLFLQRAPLHQDSSCVMHGRTNRLAISAVAHVYACKMLLMIVQEWHSDGPPSKNGQEAYGLCVFAPLIDLTETTGCTEFWPGSHIHEHLIGFGPAAPVLESTFKGYVAAGDVILYDYRVLHRGLENVCSGGRRDVLQIVYHKPEYREERNYSAESLIDPSTDL